MLSPEIIKGSLFVVGGIAIGSVATYFVTKNHIQKQTDEIIDAEVNKMRDHYRDELQRIQEDRPEDKEPPETEESEVDVVDRETPDFKTYNNMASDKYRGAFLKSSDRETQELDSWNNERMRAETALEIKAEIELEESLTVENSDNPPTLIDFDTYLEDIELGKEQIVYFEDGGVILDGREEIFANSSIILGDEFKSAFGTDESHDPDIVYVRNHVQKIDYEITRETMSFQTYMHGLQTVQMEDDHRPIRKMRESD